jgi:hypothetical protein
MAQGKLEITVGGIADMATPMRVDENLSRGVYEGFFMCKLTVAGGSPHYLKLRVVGSDDFDNEGEVPVGWGMLQFEDPDGDIMRGRTDWYRADEQDRGTWTWSSGTGKWEGVTGTAEMVLNYTTHDPITEIPPTSPVRFYGFIEGEGDMDAPALDG